MIQTFKIVQQIYSVPMNSLFDMEIWQDPRRRTSWRRNQNWKPGEEPAEEETRIGNLNFVKKGARNFFSVNCFKNAYDKLWYVKLLTVNSYLFQQTALILYDFIIQ